ncbi:aminoglycoside phosphotransferase family protein [Actinocatenispora comari]|uniref:Phosphotransferase n=1 Tax=Actinocatenispora comari TaxID=2807577 RepID=A0A8J4AH55_9ACTN|nr:aminoglycoside phosphotransferase family protein [Actinocatenispora comari]GIL29450.1 phosphotransferase [Actinocatenispora comari]
MSARMHADQVDLTEAAVAALVAEQFPRWAALPVRRVGSHGTVNALYRLGDELVARFPLRPDDGAELRAERDHARLLAPHLPMPVPETVGIGGPGAGYPGAWSVCRWLAGDSADRRPPTDRARLATDLAGFVAALHAVDTGGRAAVTAGRGSTLSTLDDEVRAALRDCAELVDTGRLTRIWDDCLAADPYRGPGAWLHADLMPGNLLLRDDTLVAVLDLGTVRVGDPAVDLMPAWNLFDADARARYRDVLGVDDQTWRRGRGWTLLQAIVALPYYVHTNPVMADTARRTLAALLAE